MMMMIWQWCALNSVIICILSAITQNNAGMICAFTKAEQKSFKSKPMWSNRRVHQQQNCRQLTHYRTFGTPIRVIAYAHERNSIQPGPINAMLGSFYFRILIFGCDVVGSTQLLLSDFQVERTLSNVLLMP